MITNKLKKYRIDIQKKEDIEAEEIFLDAKVLDSEEKKDKLEKPIESRNFFFLFFLIIIGLILLWVKIGYLQIIKGEYYSQLAQKNSSKTDWQPAPRGIIYDHKNRPLVYNFSQFNLVIDLLDFKNNSLDQQNEIINRLSEIINQSPEKILEKIKTQEDKPIITISKNLSQDKILLLENFIDIWPGVKLQQIIKRKYIDGVDFSHILGYVGLIGPSELKDYPEYYLNEYVGRSGLEQSYEKILHGKPGQEIWQVNALGRRLKKINTQKPIPGLSLVLWIDSTLQKKLTETLERILKKIHKTKAAAIALDPRNGAILALVSLPNFDNNLLTQGLSQEEYQKLSTHPSQPFLNRAISGLYPPGSTIKPLLGAAGLQEEIINPYSTIDCQGELRIPNQYNPKIVYRFLDWKKHGPTNLIKAIAESCDVYFYRLAGGYGQQNGLGVKKIKKYLKLFGLGEKTGIDLPNEKNGLIPDPEWKKQTKKEKWYIGDTYHLGIGQGDLLVTPLQIAVATSVIANEGTLYQPQLVKKIINSQKETIEEKKPKIIRKNFVKKEYLKIIKKGMRETVLSGSARSLRSLSIPVAGKTGTAQFGPKKETHAWFTCFAPYPNPEIVLTILIEEGGEGSFTAVPVAKEVLEWYFKK